MTQINYFSLRGEFNTIKFNVIMMFVPDLRILLYVYYMSCFFFNFCRINFFFPSSALEVIHYICVLLVVNLNVLMKLFKLTFLCQSPELFRIYNNLFLIKTGCFRNLFDHDEIWHAAIWDLKVFRIFAVINYLGSIWHWSRQNDKENTSIQLSSVFSYV